MQGSAGYMVLHVDLFVRSMTRSLEFYCERMGFKIADDSVLRGDLVRYISNGLCEEARVVLLRASPLGAMIELLELRPCYANGLAACISSLRLGALSVLVPDLDGHIEHARRNGLRPASEVFTVKLPRHGECRLVFFEDPDLNRLEFIQRC